MTVANAALISTSADQSTGIVAQSIGGGGSGGAVKTPGAPGGGDNVNLDIGLGGDSGTGGNGGAVSVSSFGGITTTGDGALGLLAQSVGGGGDAGTSQAGTATTDSVFNSVVVEVGGTGGAGSAGQGTQTSRPPANPARFSGSTRGAAIVDRGWAVAHDRHKNGSVRRALGHDQTAAGRPGDVEATVPGDGRRCRGRFRGLRCVDRADGGQRCRPRRPSAIPWRSSGRSSARAWTAAAGSLSRCARRP